MGRLFDAPWKIWNNVERWLLYPVVRVLFIMKGIGWGKGWKFYGIPIIQKYRGSVMRFGPGIELRSSVRSNPLGATHATILCTWQPNAVLEIGEKFSMTGGSIVATERITIGNRVTVGANTTIIDTDFHPIDPEQRKSNPQEADTKPVCIEDDAFIGMNCLILKGVTIGRGSVVGAGSVVTSDVSAGTMVAGNPARFVRNLKDS